MPKEINKIVLGDTSIIDLMQVNATPSDVIKGYTFHKADGTIGTGTAILGVTVSGSRISVPGKTYEPPSWTDGTVEEIIEALNLHHNGHIDLSSIWSIGDERTITLTNGEEIIYKIDKFNGTGDILIVPKYILYTQAMGGNDTTWSATSLRTWLNSTYYNLLPADIQPIFRQYNNAGDTTDYFCIPSDNSYGILKDKAGNAINYWGCVRNTYQTAKWQAINTLGTYYFDMISNSLGVYPIGAI